MTLPLEMLKRRPPASECDVIVVGAGLGGLVCAVTLALAGRSVVVVDRAKRPGGRLQTVNHQGFAVDLGPVLWEAGLESLLEGLGIQEHGLVPLSLRDSIRLSIAGPDGPASGLCPLPVPGAVPSPSILDAVRNLYGAPPRLFAALGEVYDEWANATPEQHEQWGGLDVESWLAERDLEAALAGAVQRSAVLLGGPPDTSVAVLAALSRALVDGQPTHLMVGDTPVAGARGIVQALVDILIEAGGELRLGTRALGLGLDGDRFARLAIRREETPFIEELAASRCVFAIPPGDLHALLPDEPRAAFERFLPPEEPERELCVAWGLGEEEDSSEEEEPPERPAAVRVVAPARVDPAEVPTAGATMVWSTVPAPRLAPPGHSLVRASLPVPFGLGSSASDLEDRVDDLRATLFELVPEAVDTVVWEHRWIGEHPFAHPLRLSTLPLVAPGMNGVLLVGQEVSVAGVMASGVTAAALSGRAAAERLLADGFSVSVSEPGEGLEEGDSAAEGTESGGDESAEDADGPGADS